MGRDKKSRHKIWIKRIALVLSIAFLWQDIVWANPDISCLKTNRDSLQTETIFTNPANEPRLVGRFLTALEEKLRPGFPGEEESILAESFRILERNGKQNYKLQKYPENSPLCTRIDIEFPNGRAFTYYDPRVYTAPPLGGEIPVSKLRRYLHKQIKNPAPKRESSANSKKETSSREQEFKGYWEKAAPDKKIDYLLKMYNIEATEAIRTVLPHILEIAEDESEDIAVRAVARDMYKKRRIRGEIPPFRTVAKKIDMGNYYELHVTLIPEGHSAGVNAQFKDCLKKLVKILEKEGVRDNKNVVRQKVFIRANDNKEFLDRKKECENLLGPHMPPTSFIAQNPDDYLDVTMECVAVVPKINAPSPIEIEQKKLSVVHDNFNNEINYAIIKEHGLKWLFVEGINAGEAAGDDIEKQSDIAFRLMEALLHKEGMEFADIVRQWNYIENITKLVEEEKDGRKEINQRYQVFNNTRGFYYDKKKELWVNGNPAATGIGAFAGGVVLGCVALKSLRKDVRVVPIINPLQISAHQYTKKVLEGKAKSAPRFERAKAIVKDGVVRIFISGTAAIRGEETCKGNARDQARLTLENIETLISRKNLENHDIRAGATLADISQATVYVKYMRDVPDVLEECRAKLPNAAINLVVADVCRPKLLVEVEGIATTAEDKEKPARPPKQIEHPSTDMAIRRMKGQKDKYVQSYDGGDDTNAFIRQHIDKGVAIEIDEGNEKVHVIRMGPPNPRDPPDEQMLEELFRRNGMFKRIREAKNPAILGYILSARPNFEKYSEYEKEELIRIAKRTHLSFILGESLIGIIDKIDRKTGKKKSRDKCFHCRTGLSRHIHHLNPTIWIGEVCFNRLGLWGRAQYILEEAQHILHPPEYLLNTGWIYTDGEGMYKISHDKLFVESFDTSEPSASERATVIALDGARNGKPSTGVKREKSIVHGQWAKEAIERNAENIIPLLVNALMIWATRHDKEELALLLDMPPAESQKIKDLINNCVIKPLKRINGNNEDILELLENLTVYDRDDVDLVRRKVFETGKLKEENLIIVTSELGLKRFEDFQNAFITALGFSELEKIYKFDEDRYYYPYVEAVFFAVIRALGSKGKYLWEWYRKIPNIELNNMDEETLKKLCFDSEGNPAKVIILRLIRKIEPFDPNDLASLYAKIEQFLRSA